MAEAALITKTDITKYWHMGKNLNDDRINPHILRAQQAELKPFLGDALYFDFVTNMSEDKYVTLLNGGEYEYQNNTVFFGGAKPLLAAWAYSRIVGNNQIFVGRGGVTMKDTEESTQHPNPLVQQRDRDAQSEAIRLQHELWLFLDQNRTTYPLYGRGVDSNTPTGESFRFTKV